VNSRRCAFGFTTRAIGSPATAIVRACRWLGSLMPRCCFGFSSSFSTSRSGAAARLSARFRSCFGAGGADRHPEPLRALFDGWRRRRGCCCPRFIDASSPTGEAPRPSPEPRRVPGGLYVPAALCPPHTSSDGSCGGCVSSRSAGGHPGPGWAKADLARQTPTHSLVIHAERPGPRSNMVEVVRSAGSPRPATSNPAVPHPQP